MKQKAKLFNQKRGNAKPKSGGTNQNGAATVPQAETNGAATVPQAETNGAATVPHKA